VGPGDDAFKAHQAHLLAALARRVLRHHGDCLARTRGSHKHVGPVQEWRQGFTRDACIMGVPALMQVR
jgi:hypothetical protein